MALVVATAACSGADKAGGDERKPKPLVLTLEQSDPLYSGRAFAAAVARRSGGKIRIDVDPELHRKDVHFERDIVDDVRARTSDLGVVGVRVWDTLGVKSYQALIAPFLVDNLELERRVLESPLVASMLRGVARTGVVGIATLPGPPRRPFGYSRPLIRLQDYKGTRLGVYPGRVEEATLRSLGAQTRLYLSLGGASREGAILNFWAIAGEPGYHGKTMAANLVFWMRPETVVMNRRAFEALTPTQRAILRDAGRNAMADRLAEIVRIETNALRTTCERKLAALVTVPPVEVTAIHEAVRPVYGELERVARTRAMIDAIRKLRASEPKPRADSVQCPPAATRAASSVEGRWRSHVTPEALRAAGASRAEAATYEGSGTLDLRDRRWTFRGDHTTVTGSYAVAGSVVRFTMRTCTANPCSPGSQSEYTWSVYRDTLSLAARPGESAWPALVASARRRVG